MPRSQSSPESRVLAYFKDAPLAAVLVVVGLVKEIVKDRQAEAATPVVVKRRKRRTVHAPVPAVAAAHQTTAAKKSHKKKVTPSAQPATDAPELDDLN